MRLSIKQIRYNFQKEVIDLLSNLNRVPDKTDQGIIWWVRNDEWYLQQDEKNKALWCHYDRIWSIIGSSYDMQFTETQVFIRDIMKKHFKLGYLTPLTLGSTQTVFMEKHFKLGYLTPVTAC